MTEVPPATPVTVPLEAIVAILVDALDHVPPVDVLDQVAVLP